MTLVEYLALRCSLMRLDTSRQQDAFVGILSEKSQREHLENLDAEAADGDELWNHVRDLGNTFQDGLNALFLDHPEN